MRGVARPAVLPGQGSQAGAVGRDGIPHPRNTPQRTGPMLPHQSEAKLSYEPWMSPSLPAPWSWGSPPSATRASGVGRLPTASMPRRARPPRRPAGIATHFTALPHRLRAAREEGPWVPGSPDVCSTGRGGSTLLCPGGDGESAPCPASSPLQRAGEAVGAGSGRAVAGFLAGRYPARTPRWV